MLAALVVALLLAAAQATGLISNPETAQRTSQPLPKGLLQGKVIKVADGDTVTLLDDHGQKHKIRLLGIDAPETKQAHGLAAREWLTRRVLNQTIQVQITETDRYQRQVGKLLAQSPDCSASSCPFDRDVNLALVEQGHAWWYEAYQKNQPYEDRRVYSQAQAQAQNARLGLWGRPSPTAPWDWRKEQRNPQ